MPDPAPIDAGVRVRIPMLNQGPRSPFDALSRRRPADPSPAAQAAVRAAARHVATHVDELHAAIVAQALERVPLAQDGSHLVTSLSDAVVANLGAFIALLSGRLDGESPEPLDEEYRFAANLARAGRPVDDLLRVYLTTQTELETLWRRALRDVADGLDVFAEADELSTPLVARIRDAVTPALSHHHAVETSRRISPLTTRRAGTLRRALFDPDVDQRAVSARLGYELDRWHVCHAATVPDGVHEVDDVLDEVIEAVERVAGRRPLATRAGDRVVQIWVGFPEAPDLAPLPGLEHVVAAVGRPARGLDGFRRSRYEAVRALDLAVGMRRPTGTVTAFGDVEVLALLSAEPDEAASFAVDVLGEVYATGAGPGFVETMRILYEEHLNVARAAERLGVHRNTVAYRLRRVLELSGESNPVALRLHAAVTLAPLVPAWQSVETA